MENVVSWRRQRMVIILVLLICLYINQSETSTSNGKKGKTVSKWDYGPNGPSTWEKDAPQCHGANQSPIDIDEESELSSPTFRHYINNTNYGEKAGFKKYNMSNTGHALEIKIPANTHYRLQKGDEQYIPIQINIHFDSINNKGSEHMIDGKKFFAEVQIFHRNLRYTQNEVLNHPDGLVNALLGIAVLVDKRKDGDDDEDYLTEEEADEDTGVNDNDDNEDISNTDNVDDKNNQTEESDYTIHRKRTIYGYEEEYRAIMGGGEGSSFVMNLIARHSTKIRKPGEVTRIDAFPLGWLLPTVKREDALFDYINYFGSLTTPPCLEIVDWVVMTGRTLITNESTGKRLMKILDNSGKQMAGNNRPPQDINGRNIYGVQGKIPR